jgi:hypothetical protein
MKLTGHRSLQTMHGYDRRAKRWQNPASGRAGALKGYASTLGEKRLIRWCTGEPVAGQP